MGAPAGMGGLMNMGCIEAVGVVEGAEIRHVDAVFGDVIIGAGRAVDGIDAERGDEGFGGGEAFAVGQDRPRFGRIAIDLIGVEQAEGLGEEPAVVAVFIVAAFVALRAKLLPEDAEAGVLALADLRAERLPLAIGAPDPARIAAAIGSRPDRDRIYAALGLAAGDVGRAGDVASETGRAHVELQSLMRNSYAAYFLTNKITNDNLPPSLMSLTSLQKTLNHNLIWTQT